MEPNMELQNGFSDRQTHHETESYKTNDDKRMQSETSRSRSKKSGNNESRTPSEAELCDIVILMKQMLPKKSLEKAILMFYDYTVKKKPAEKVFCDYIPPMSHIPEAYKNYQYKPKNREEIIKDYSKQDLSPIDSLNQTEATRYKQKRQIAKSFVSQGYGVDHAITFLRRSKMPSNITKDNYKLIMGSIISQTFRKIQDFLIHECDIKIKPIGKEEMSKTISYLTQKHENSSYISVFKKFLRFNYGLSQVQICQIETVHFYLELMKHLHKKRLSVEGIQLYFSKQTFFDQRSDSINGGQLNDNHSRNSLKCEKPNTLVEAYANIVDNQILKIYIQTKSINQTADNLYRLYPSWTSKAKIIGKLTQYLKKALKKLNEDVNSYEDNVPKLSLRCMSQSEINIIFKSRQSKDIRSSLLDYYLKSHQSKDDLFFLVEMINDFIDIVRADPSKQLDLNDSVTEDNDPTQF